MKKLVTYGIGEFLNKGLNILLVLFLPLLLNAKDFGIISILISVESILITLYMMGQNNIVLRFFHNFKNKIKFQNSVFLVWVINSLSLSFLALICLLLLYKITNDILYLYTILLIPIAIFSAFREIHLMIFRVLDKVKNFIILKASFQILKFIFIFFLIYLGMDVLSYLLGTLIAVLVVFLFELRQKNRVFTLNFLSLDYYKNRQFRLSKLLFLFGVPLMIHAISNFLLASSDRFMIYYLMSAKDVGIYSLAYTISSSMVFFMYIFGLVFLPSFYKNHKSYTNEAANALRKMTMYNLIISTIIGLLIYLIVYFTIHLYGNEYQQIMNFFYILIISYIIYPLYLHGNYKAMLLKKNTSIPKATFMALITNIALNFWLIPSYGLSGAAISTLIGNVALIVMINNIGKKGHVLNG